MFSMLPYLEISFPAPTSPTPLTPGTLSAESPQMASMSMIWTGSRMPHFSQMAVRSTISSSPPDFPGLYWNTCSEMSCP